MTGTPKTIMQAIDNGVEAYSSKLLGSNCAPWECNEIIEKHVRDFLAQRFGAALLSNDNPEVIKAIAELAESVGLEIGKVKSK